MADGLNNEDILMESIEQGNVEKIKQLVSLDKDLIYRTEQRGKSPLWTAVRLDAMFFDPYYKRINNYPEIAEILLEAGVNPDERPPNPPIVLI
jgi:hypothetical protein